MEKVGLELFRAGGSFTCGTCNRRFEHVVLAQTAQQARAKLKTALRISSDHHRRKCGKLS